MGRMMWYRITRHPQGPCPVVKMMGLGEWDTQCGIGLRDIHRSFAG